MTRTDLPDSPEEALPSPPTAGPLDADETLDRLLTPQVRQHLQDEWVKANTVPPPPAAPKRESLIPQPEFPYPLGHPLSCLARFPCRLVCGWAHDEQPDLDPIGPIVIPVNGGMAAVTKAIDARAQERFEQMRARIEDAMRNHYRTAHGLDVDE